MENEIRPIVLNNNETGDTYTLEFNRESVKFAERMGFNISDIEKTPMSSISDLFFYAFRMHHRNITKDKTDKILTEDLGGVTDAMIERLAQLYAKPFETLIADEGKGKNSRMTVKM